MSINILIWYHFLLEVSANAHTHILLVTRQASISWATNRQWCLFSKANETFIGVFRAFRTLQ